MSEGWFVHVVLLKHYYGNVLRFLLKLYKYECGWGKLLESGMLKLKKI